MTHPKIEACEHLYALFDPKQRREIIKYIISCLKPHIDEFDAIAVSGYSMALIVPTIADRMKKNIVLVRKTTEDCHSSLLHEGILEQRVVFVDDLIAWGYTFGRVKRGVEDLGGKLVGYVTYEKHQRDHATDSHHGTPSWTRSY